MRRVANITEAMINKHVAVSTYGDFELTDAIRPALGLPIVPTEGYRHGFYQKGFETPVPVLLISATKRKLMDLFMNLADVAGEMPNVVLESSHTKVGNEPHKDFHAPEIDLPVLKSILMEHEDMLLNDGNTGVAIYNEDPPIEVQFDEHKILIVYGEDLAASEKILEQHGVPLNEDIKLLIDGEHIHQSAPKYDDEFEELRAKFDAERDMPKRFLQTAGGGEDDAEAEEWKESLKEEEIIPQPIDEETAMINREFAKADDKLVLLAQIESEEDADVDFVYDTVAIHGMEVIGELEDSLVLWDWKGPNDYDYRLLSKKTLPGWQEEKAEPPEEPAPQGKLAKAAAWFRGLFGGQ